MVQSNRLRNVRVKCRNQQAAFNEGAEAGFVAAQRETPCDPDCYCNYEFCADDCDTCNNGNFGCNSGQCEPDD